ncbi:hypothetical protein BDW71DRAFT_181896 [Aspergillus fruticulosus]
MAPAAAKPERLLSPATDYERWLGKDDQDLDSVRQFDPDRGADDYSDDGLIMITGDSGSPEIVDNSNQPGSPTLSSDESTQPDHRYHRPTVPDIIALYAALIIAVLLVRRLYTLLTRSRRRRRPEESKGQL